MKVGELIKHLKEFDPDRPVLIGIPQRFDQYQTSFAAELTVVTYHEYNDAADSPLLWSHFYEAEGPNGRCKQYEYTWKQPAQLVEKGDEGLQG